MCSLFSPAGLQRLDTVIGPRLLCAFDFDGTLAPIVPVPAQAHLPEEIRDLLLRLSVHAPVAIITGRSVQDIRGRLGFEPDFVVGNHGLEGVPGWETLALEHEALCRMWWVQLTQALNGVEYDSGIMLEDKGYSLSVHYRGARNADHAARALEQLFARLSPRPRVVAGKYVFNLLAEDACHKGSALARIMQLCAARNAVYVGDDVTDEDVFRLRRKDVLSIRVERSDDSAADFYLPHPHDILFLLEELVHRLRLQEARNWRQAATVGSA